MRGPLPSCYRFRVVLVGFDSTTDDARWKSSRTGRTLHSRVFPLASCDENAPRRLDSGSTDIRNYVEPIGPRLPGGGSSSTLTAQGLFSASGSLYCAAAERLKVSFRAVATCASQTSLAARSRPHAVAVGTGDWTVPRVKSEGDCNTSSNSPRFIRLRNRAADRAWQLIDRCGLNSMSVNPA